MTSDEQDRQLTLIDVIEEEAAAEHGANVLTYMHGALGTLPAKVSTELVATAPTIPPAKAESFAEQAMDLVASREFLEMYSQELGTPRDGESREDFISRGQELLRRLLRMILGV